MALSREQIDQYIDLQITDPLNRQNTAARVRDVLHEMNTSMFNVLNDTFTWSNITGDPEDNSDLTDYIESLVGAPGSFVPLAGTDSGLPILGDLEVESGTEVFSSDGSTTRSSLILTDSIATLSNINLGNDDTTIIKVGYGGDAYVTSDVANFPGLRYGGNYNADFEDDSLVDKQWVDGAISAALAGIDLSDYLELAGGTMSGNILFNTTKGIDTDAAGTLNIGATNATIINIGRTGQTVNIIGDTLYENVTNLTVTDKLITLNKGGAVTSGDGVGFEIEENSVITGYFKVSAARTGWDLKAPATAGVATFITDATSRTYTLPGATGTLALTSDIVPTFLDSVFRIQDDGDATKQLAWEVSGITASTTRTITAVNYSGTSVLSNGALTATRIPVASAAGLIDYSTLSYDGTTLMIDSGASQAATALAALKSGSNFNYLMRIQNSNSGTSSSARVMALNNSSNQITSIMYSSAWTTDGFNTPDAGAIFCNGSAGLNLAAFNATGKIGFYTGSTSTNLRGTITTLGQWVVGNSSTAYEYLTNYFSTYTTTILQVNSGITSGTPGYLNTVDFQLVHYQPTALRPCGNISWINSASADSLATGKDIAAISCSTMAGSNQGQLSFHTAYGGSRYVWMQGNVYGIIAPLKVSIGSNSTPTYDFTVTATSAAGKTINVHLNLTAGASITNAIGQRIALTGGSGNTSNIATEVYNDCIGTSTDLRMATDFNGPAGNVGYMCYAYGTTVGNNTAIYGEARLGGNNIGVYGKAVGAKASAKNIGVLGLGYNSNVTSPISIGGFFGIGTSTFTFEDSALIADNGTSTYPIFLGRDNGSVVFNLIDGGKLFLGGSTTPTSRLHLAAGSTTVSPLKFTSGTNLTTAEAGAIEYNGTNFFATRVGTTRENIICASAVNAVSPTAPDKTITVNIDGTTYYVHAKTTND